MPRLLKAPLVGCLTSSCLVAAPAPEQRHCSAPTLVKLQRWRESAVNGGVQQNAYKHTPGEKCVREFVIGWTASIRQRCRNPRTRTRSSRTSLKALEVAMYCLRSVLYTCYVPHSSSSVTQMAPSSAPPCGTRTAACSLPWRRSADG